MQLSADLAALIGFACESVLWGVNCTLFITSLIILGRHHRLREHLHNPVIHLNCLIFVCCTTHFALEFNHFYTTLYATGVLNYSAETKVLLAADFLISVTDLFGDFALIYRCWMLWGRNYLVIILPLLTAVGGFSCICGVTALLIRLDPTAPAPPQAIVPLGLVGYIFPLCTNIMVTSLIVYRIWSASRSIPDSPFQVGHGATGRAMMFIIESGTLYLLFQLAFVVAFAISNNAEGILAVMAVQIYGIAPTLIIIRVGLGISSENTTGAAVSTRIKWVPHRVEGSSADATGSIDGPVVHTDYEGMKEFSSPENHQHDAALKVQFVPSCSSGEGAPSPV